MNDGWFNLCQITYDDVEKPTDIIGDCVHVQSRPWVEAIVPLMQLRASFVTPFYFHVITLPVHGSVDFVGSTSLTLPENGGAKPGLSASDFPDIVLRGKYSLLE